jgi:hypothetical protein
MTGRNTCFTRPFCCHCPRCARANRYGSCPVCRYCRQYRRGYRGLCTGGGRGGNLGTSLHGVPSALQSYTLHRAHWGYVNFIKDIKTALYRAREIYVDLKGQWDVSYVIIFLVFIAMEFNIMLLSIMATCDISVLEERTISIFTVLVPWRWKQNIRPVAGNTFWWPSWPQYILSLAVISN